MKNLLEEIKYIYLLSDPNRMSEDELVSDMRGKRNVTFFLALAALVLSAVNIYKKFWLMALTTLLIALVMFLCSLLARDVKNRKAVSIICTLCFIFVFTYYAVSGQNDGFAILWTLLVPPIGSLLVGLRAGFLMGLYFELVFIVIFWSAYFPGIKIHYTETFCLRYPLLYCVSFLSSLFLVARKDMYKRQAEDMAFLDILTGLYNRRYYEEMIRKIWKIGKFEKITIYMIDVNRLKYTNDNYGHSAGDALLISVANYLRSVFDVQDYICRIGGDEFSIITLKDKDTINERLENLKNFVFEWQGKVVPEPSLSTGVVSVCDYPRSSVKDIEKYADEAMYRAKEEYYRTTGVDRRVR